MLKVILTMVYDISDILDLLVLINEGPCSVSITITSAYRSICRPVR